MDARQPPLQAPLRALPGPRLSTFDRSLTGLGTGAGEVDVAHREEAARARAIGAILAVLAIFTLSFLPFIGGAVWLRVLTGGTLLLLAATGAVVSLLARDPGRYGPWAFRAFGVSAVLCSVAVQYHLGVFSPTPLAVTLGIAFFGQGQDRWAVPICASAIAGYAVLTALIVFGIVPDLGVFPGDAAPLWARVFMLLIVPTVLGLTLFQARVSRQAVLDAMDNAAAAARAARAQEAQADELRAQLDQALAPGRKGHYTGRRAGRWSLSELLGRGAMAEVYAADDAQTGQAAAVKLLYPHLVTEEKQLQRFAREGEIAAQLSSPHLVQVFDVGRAHDGAPFLAMERLHGDDLAGLLRKGRLSLDEVGVLLAHAGAGLDAVHAAGIVHRDLKPGNVFRAQLAGGDVTWKLLDFGISKFAASNATLTEGDLIGTPAYMPPEQARGESVGPACDVYGLGGVAYRAITGQPPFRGRGVTAVLAKVLESRPVRPSDLVPSVPASVEGVLAVSMAPDRRSGTRGERSWRRPSRRPPRGSSRWTKRRARPGSCSAGRGGGCSDEDEGEAAFD